MLKFRTLRPVIMMVWSLVIGLHATEPVAAQEEGRMRFVHWTYQDAGALVQHLGTHMPVVAFGGAALLTPATGLDPFVLNGVQRGYHGPLASCLNVTNELGGTRATPVVAGVFAASLVTRNRRFQDAAFTSLQALVYAGAITDMLKSVFGRYRPEVGGGAYRVDPFSGNTSFPSGHTTAAFALVTPWVLYYPNTATYGLFALSTGTAVARIALDKHWPTDVLAGAAIGFFTARFLTRRHQQEATGPRFNLRPMVGLNGTGVRFQVRLD